MAADQHGNLFIAESGAGRIRQVAPDGTISTVALTPTPVGVAVDTTGNLYLSDQYLNTVSRVSLATGEVTLVVGSGALVADGASCRNQGGEGLAINAQLCYPSGLALDSLGNLYIADSFNNLIRMVTPDGHIHTVAGSGESGNPADGDPAIAARFDAPSAVLVDDGRNIYIADSRNYRISKVTPDGLIARFAGSCFRQACRGRRHHHYGRGRWPIFLLGRRWPRD